MIGFLKRWWRWATNPPAIEGQLWRVDGIGIVEYRGLAKFTIYRVVAVRVSDGREFEWLRGDFYSLAVPSDSSADLMSEINDG